MKDEREARQWRGALFEGFKSPLMWLDKAKGYYEMLEPPTSVTFPICGFCGHIIWDWPHFEEPIPEKAICDKCCEEDMLHG